MTDVKPTTRDPGPSLAIGGLLILVGVLWLLSEALDLDVWSGGWPFFLIVPGVAGLIAGLATDRAGLGAAIPGALLTVIGLLLLYQNTTGHWESWAYAWALVAPGAVGLALLLVGARTGDTGLQASGTTTLTVALVIFIVGFVFFEVLIGISGRDFGLGADVVLPALLIGFGAYFVVRSASART